MTKDHQASLEQTAREWLINNGFPHWAGHTASLVALLAAQRAAVLEEVAGQLQDEVDSHRKEHGEHQYCEDYGCHFLEEQAKSIRLKAQE